MNTRGHQKEINVSMATLWECYDEWAKNAIIKLYAIKELKGIIEEEQVLSNQTEIDFNVEFKMIAYKKDRNSRFRNETGQ